MVWRVRVEQFASSYRPPGRSKRGIFGIKHVWAVLSLVTTGIRADGADLARFISLKERDAAAFYDAFKGFPRYMVDIVA
jgi:hypothetical protein